MDVVVAGSDSEGDQHDAAIAAMMDGEVYVYSRAHSLPARRCDSDRWLPTVPAARYGDFEDFQTGETVRGTAPAVDSDGSGSDEDSGSDSASGSDSDSDASAEGLTLAEQRERNRAKKAKLKKKFDEQCVSLHRCSGLGVALCTMAGAASPHSIVSRSSP